MGVLGAWVAPNTWQMQFSDGLAPEKSWAFAEGKSGAALMMQPLFEGIANQHVPAVVQLQYIKHDERPFGPDLLDDVFLDDEDRSRHPFEIDGKVVGTGFIYREDGYIVTTSHMLNYMDEVHVILHDKTRLVAQVVGMDPATHVAVLKVDAFGLPVIPFTKPASIEQGQWVMSIGTPMESEFRNTITLGVVSATGPALQLDSTRASFMTDAVLSFGNSGSPLLNSKGQLLGMANISLVQSEDDVPFSEVVWTQSVAASAEAIIARGEGDRGQIGVQYMSIAENQGPEGAAQIIHVVPGSAAAEAGMQRGDVVLAVDGNALEKNVSFSDRIAASRPGDVVTLKVQRNGEEMDVQIAVEEQPDRRTANRDEDKDPQQRLMAEMGFTVDNLDEEMLRGLRVPIRDGVVVLYVSPTSVSYREGDLRGGMILVEMADQRIRNRTEFMRVYNEIPRGVTFLVLVHRPEERGAMLTALTKPE
ncbi:MAG: S1C family serine protease [Rhodothermaceae bacterium]|nr:S1C family serine protease [Rhodothermaceae bacterium]